MRYSFRLHAAFLACGSLLWLTIVVSQHLVLTTLTALPLLILAIIPFLIAGWHDRARGRQRAAATVAVSRSDLLASVLTATHYLWRQQEETVILSMAAETALVLSGAETVTAYIPDPDDAKLFMRLVLAPPDAVDSSPVYLPRALAARGLHTDINSGWFFVPLTDGERVAVGVLALKGLAHPLGGDDEVAMALRTLAAHTTGALENRQRQEQLRIQASVDGLTGLFNHRTFNARLSDELTRAARNKQAVSVVMIDLDDFGMVNNTYGHPTGDTLLSAVAAALRNGTRDFDIVARYGGDEFAVILPETDIDEALVVATRVQQELATITLDGHGTLLRPGASIGVATVPRHAQTQEEVMHCADQAAYIAKRSGKGRVARPEELAVSLPASPDNLVAQLEHANLATVEALAAAVDAKDPYTRGHAQRVSNYAEAIARTLQLPSDVVMRVRLAGLLHDVGKIGIPDAILTKSGPLDDSEFALLQQHPVIGERMLAAVPYLHAIVPAVRHHHERWDGGGYPDGLEGKAIPHDATILMVADAFDAMTTSRTYRPALPLGEARRRICEGSGLQFDPRIVEAFENAYVSGHLVPIAASGTKTLDSTKLPVAVARASARLGSTRPLSPTQRAG